MRNISAEKHSNITAQLRLIVRKYTLADNKNHDTQKERITMTTTIHIEQSDAEREKLERVAELYKDFGYSVEEVARLLLHDAVRAKYNALSAEKEPITEEQREEEERAYFEAFGYTLVGEGDSVELVDLSEL